MLLISLFSCTSEFEKEHINSEAIDDIVMQTTGFRAEPSSRTYPSINNGYVDILWSENDVVGVFTNEGSQAAFPMNSAAGTTQASFNGGGWALKASYKYAAYYPYEFNNRDYTKIPVSYLGQKQIGKNTSTHTGPYNYMVASANTPSEGKVSFTFQNMGCMVIMDLTVPEPTTLKTVVLSVKEAKFTTKGEINIMEATPTITPTTYSDELRIDLENVTTTSANEVVTIYFMTAPINLYGKTINVQVYDSNGNLRETSIAGKNLETGGFYSLVGTLPTVPTTSNVFTVPQAGKLSEMITDAQKYVITEMKIIGNLNSEDILFIREMAGRDVNGYATEGNLINLDISEASIVSSKDPYYSSYCTEDNIIGESMFSGSKLQKVQLPNTITTIKEHAFSGSDLNSISIPNSVTSIGRSCFYGCNNLNTINLGNGVKKIDIHTFSECQNLKNISIPEGVTEIASGAFYNTPLEYVYLPASLLYIEGGAFAYNNNFKEIHIKATKVPEFINSSVMLGQAPFYECILSSCILYVPTGTKTLYASSLMGKDMTNIKEE